MAEVHAAVDSPGDPEYLRWVAGDLSNCGYRVFPVLGKVPLLAGYHGAEPYSLHALDAMDWQRATGLGWSLPPGFVGLDVDVKASGQARMLGDVQLAELESELGQLPQSFRQSTPSGGWHIVLRAELPTRLPGKLWLPDGTSCDIDIARYMKRMLALYDPVALLEADFEDLPDAWSEYLRLPPGRGVQAVAEAPVGQRNETLNRTAFVRALREEPSEALRQELAQAAQFAGLPDVEIEATLTSAFKAAELERQPVLDWFAGVCSDPRILAKRNRRRVIAAAARFKELCLLLNRTQIGMSSREMAEHIGVQQPAAADILGLLVQCGHLSRTASQDRQQAHTYLLNTSKSSASQVSHPEGEQRLSCEAEVCPSRLQEILRHDVFRRRKAAGWLPESAGVLLFHLERHGSSARRGLAKACGLSHESLNNALKALSPYLQVSGKHVGLAEPVDALLQRIAVEFDAVGRGAELKAKHEEQRRQHAAGLQLRKSVRYGRGNRRGYG